jgi:nitroreductase
MVIDIIKTRWSPLSFANKPVEEDRLKTIFEAAGLAPSSRNEQPWMFIFSTRKTPGKFNDFLNFLDESNRVWAKSAGVIIISMTRTKYSSIDRVNRYAFHDTGMAEINMILQAISMDIYVHQMGGFSREKVKEYFNLDENVEPVTMMALGYLGDGSELNDELRKRHFKRKTRKNINEYIFRNDLYTPAF